MTKPTASPSNGFFVLDGVSDESLKLSYALDY